LRDVMAEFGAERVDVLFLRPALGGVHVKVAVGTFH